jgi:hypothetical protein
MPRFLAQAGEKGAGMVPDVPRRRYLIRRRQDAWFIVFAGKEFGPYRSEAEAMLFAVDAAHQFAEQHEEKTQVLGVDESGEAYPIWTYGVDPHPRH